MRFTPLLLAVTLATPAAAQTDRDARVDALFDLVQIERHMVGLRQMAITDWLDTNDNLLDGQGGQDWAQLAVDQNTPDQILADFRAGFVSVDFPDDLLDAAIEGYATPFGLRLTETAFQAMEALTGDPDLFDRHSAAQEAGDPAVALADEIMEGLGSIATYEHFIREIARSFYIAFGEAGGLPDDAPTQEDYIASYEPAIQMTVDPTRQLYRMLFFYMAENFDEEDRAAWRAFNTTPWAERFETAFQAGYLAAAQASMIRQGQAAAAFLTAQDQ